MSERELIAAARAVRKRAHAPYSGFHVGAALEAIDGTIITGCNVENASYGLTNCAERTALFAAVAAGHRKFRRMVVVADTDRPTAPCGACRQVIWELAGDIEIILAGTRRVGARVQMASLLPMPFDSRQLDEP
jgi:cytidine deaminase